MENTPFGAAIEAHLELQRRNSRLERAMPISRYREVETSARLEGRVDADAPTEAAIRTAAWDDPDSWWDLPSRSL
jgi:hypothetical protein